MRKARQSARRARAPGVDVADLRGAVGAGAVAGNANDVDDLLAAPVAALPPRRPGGNWRWRFLPGSLTPELVLRLRRFAESYGRLG